MDKQHYFDNCIKFVRFDMIKESTNHYKKVLHFQIIAALVSICESQKKKIENDNRTQVSSSKRDVNGSSKKFDKKTRLPLFNISNILLFEICIGLKQEEARDAIHKSTTFKQVYVCKLWLPIICQHSSLVENTQNRVSTGCLYFQ
ncbi:hypothetical protein RFI_29461 [Reticulomyxa filosa]|uniref:Uncharacterized protein n=1 Tax=Reticulomyxa filosa TaxID=46433 RepID=X6M1B6_RETFI|nr:hypothetical protein RFI_29461 [Reticulomyxa filosa]|eukprot:ETO07928.1 hypothetical protein RFI_29461 [Reticulomyxa filosa]